MSDERMAYIGTCKCGAVVSACVDHEDKKYVAKFCARVIRDGDILTRVPAKDVKMAMCKCPESPF